MARTKSGAEGKRVPVELLKLWIDESYRAQAPKKWVASLGPVAKKKQAVTKRSR